MPAWATITISIAAVITAIGVIWSKVLKPGARLIAQLEKTYPLLVELTVVFGGDSKSFLTVLLEIAKEFKADSGSTLRDIVNGLAEMLAHLQEQVIEAKTAADALKQGVNTAKELAEMDREQMRRIELIVARLTDRVGEAAAGDKRVAFDLAEAKVKLEGVAADLAASHGEADRIAHGGQPGEAADAASRTPVGEEDAQP